MTGSLQTAASPPPASAPSTPTALPSGYALQLALGPLDSLVAAMRLARTHKYAVLLRMVQRLHQAGQAEGWPAGESLPARLMWGPHTPTDRAAVLDEVVKGVGASVLSVETGIRMLIDAGYPIEDTQREIERIEHRAFDAAARLRTPQGTTPQSANTLVSLRLPRLFRQRLWRRET
ncbi:hypothetical protein ACWGLE_18485 [Streptomyces sp. NPDC055897]